MVGIKRNNKDDSWDYVDGPGCRTRSGYVRLTQFSRVGTARDLEQVMKKLNKAGIKGFHPRPAF